METTLDNRARQHTAGSSLASAIEWGLLGGLAGTIVMDLCLMSAFAVAGLPALTCFSAVGDTMARFFTVLGSAVMGFSAILGLQIEGGVSLGIATHYLIGPAIGASFGAVAARAGIFQVNTIKRSVGAGVLYVEVLSQPLLASMPILLGWSLAQTLSWYGGACCAHMIAGAVLGLVVHYGLRSPGGKRMNVRTRVPWWKGTHGEWYVVAQIVLMILVFFGPRTVDGWAAWAYPYAQIASFTGAALFLIGALLLAAGIVNLGAGLTAVPYPKDDAKLIENGAYGIVRHPMYSGGVMLALGWALWVNGWLTVVYALVLLLFFDVKSRREEQWLKEKFPGYRAYQRRVRKLVPYLY